MALNEQVGLDIGLYAVISETPTLLGGLRNSELTINGETIDASHAGNFGWRRKLAGQLEWSASATVVVIMDEASPFGFGSAMEYFRAQQRLRNEVEAQIQYPEGSTDEGPCIINQWQVSGPYDNVAEGSVQLEGADALTFTLNT